MISVRHLHGVFIWSKVGVQQCKMSPCCRNLAQLHWTAVGDLLLFHSLKSASNIAIARGQAKAKAHVGSRLARTDNARLCWGHRQNSVPLEEAKLSRVLNCSVLVTVTRQRVVAAQTSPPRGTASVCSRESAGSQCYQASSALVRIG